MTIFEIVIYMSTVISTYVEVILNILDTNLVSG